MKMKKADLIQKLQKELNFYRDKWEMCNEDDEYLQEEYESMIYKLSAQLKKVRFSRDTEFEV